MFHRVLALLALAAALIGGAGPLLAEDPQPGHDAHAAAAPAAAGEGAHGADHGGGGSDMIRPKEDLAIWTFVVFLVLLGVLWKFAWGPIAEALEKREHGIADQIAAAHKANDDARGLLAQYEQRLAHAQDEVRAILDEARRDAEHTKQQIVAAANAEAQSLRERSLRDIRTATDQGIKEIAETSANMAVELAGKIVGTQLKPQDHSRLVQDAIARYSSSPSSN